MQTSKLFRVDLTKIRRKGDFDCPKCGTKISPDDRTEKTYRILEAAMKGNELAGITLQCNSCENQIQLTGFNTCAQTDNRAYLPHSDLAFDAFSLMNSARRLSVKFLRMLSQCRLSYRTLQKMKLASSHFKSKWINGI